MLVVFKVFGCLVWFILLGFFLKKKGNVSIITQTEQAGAGSSGSCDARALGLAASCPRTPPPRPRVRSSWAASLKGVTAGLTGVLNMKLANAINLKPVHISSVVKLVFRAPQPLLAALEEQGRTCLLGLAAGRHAGDTVLWAWPCVPS